MAWGAIAAAVAPALIGAFANQGQGGSSQNYYTNKNVAPASADEQYAAQSQMDVLRQLQQFAGAGPGQQDISNAYNAQNDLASMLKSYSQGGFAPQASDFTTAQAQMAPQYEALRQSQIQQQQQFRQAAALSGRGPMDFAFQNKLNQNVMNQNQMLGAQQSQLASQNAMQRLGFAQDFANLKQGLATQAMQNRLAISGLGSQIRDAGANFRLGAAGGTTYQSGQSGSQQGNMLTGALAGMGTGLSLYNKFAGSDDTSSSNSRSNNAATGGGGYLGANTKFSTAFDVYPRLP